MDSFLNRKYNEFTNALQTMLDSSPMDTRTANLLCNMAITLYELELYRKCIATSQKVTELDPSCMRASLLHAKSLNKLGRNNEAISVCEEALSNTHNSIYGDAYLAMELRDLKQLMIAEKVMNETPPTNTSTTVTPVSSNTNNDNSKEISNDISSSAKKSPKDKLPSPPPTLSRTTTIATSTAAEATATNTTTPGDASIIIPPVAPTPPSVSTAPTVTTDTSLASAAAPVSAVATAVPAASSNKNTSKLAQKKISVVIDNSPAAVKHRDALQQLLVSSLNQSDTKVSPAVLRMVRSNLLCASGEDIVDDLIAFGYLQVNTNHLDKAIEVFAELLKYRSDLPAAHLGTGSAYAMMGQYEKAITAFSQAIAVTHLLDLPVAHLHS